MTDREIIMKQFFRHKYLTTIIGLMFSLLASVVYATDTDLWRESGDKKESIDHSRWQTILTTYITEKQVNQDTPAINLFSYGKVSAEHKQLLKRYLDDLQAIDPREYTEKEQFAYWVNLYNALTVDLILDNYPVKSITKLGSLLSFGPWDEDAAEVAGETLTLNDIEHKILRPIWKDPRIHYAVNCASFGCPNLSTDVFTADNTEALLEKAAHDYINHPRGLTLEGNKLTLSKIYKWYADDFGQSEQDFLIHVKQYAKPSLVKRLSGFDGKIRYEYDWSLNEPK